MLMILLFVCLFFIILTCLTCRPTSTPSTACSQTTKTTISLLIPFQYEGLSYFQKKKKKKKTHSDMQLYLDYHVVERVSLVSRDFYLWQHFLVSYYICKRVCRLISFIHRVFSGAPICNVPSFILLLFVLSLNIELSHDIFKHYHDQQPFYRLVSVPQLGLSCSPGILAMKTFPEVWHSHALQFQGHCYPLSFTLDPPSSFLITETLKPSPPAFSSLPYYFQHFA